MTKQICENGDFLIQGKSYLYNNLWGADSGSGSQCLWEASTEGAPLAWGTSWNWTGRSDTIKSYAAVVLGWHWGWRVADTGLPIQLAALRSVPTSWIFDLTHETLGGTNVTYDIWLSENPHPENEDPTGEIMIWLYQTGSVSPIGSRQTNTIIGGTAWDLWVGPHPVSGWPVYTFVRAANTKAEALDLIEFFQYLISTGLSSSTYLLSVEAGVEVFSGEGRLDTSLYSINIER